MRIIDRIKMLPWFIKESRSYVKGCDESLKRWIIALFRWVFLK